MPPASNDSAPVIIAPITSRSGSRSGAGFSETHRGRPCEGGRRAVSCKSARARRPAWSANPARARRRWGWRLLRLTSATGPIVYMGQNIDGLTFKKMQAVPPPDADRLSGSVRLAQPAAVGQPDRRGRAADPAPGDAPGGAAGAGVEGPQRSRPGPARRRTATRTSSPAASVSASPLPAPWCWSRNS